jgi:hypothetical protein
MTNLQQGIRSTQTHLRLCLSTNSHVRTYGLIPELFGLIKPCLLCMLLVTLPHDTPTHMCAQTHANAPTHTHASMHANTNTNHKHTHINAHSHARMKTHMYARPQSRAHLQVWDLRRLERDVAFHSQLTYAAQVTLVHRIEDGTGV